MMSHVQPPPDEVPEHPRPAEPTSPPRRAADPATAGQPSPEQFATLHRSDDFALLRGKFRRFAFPWTVAFLVWYFLYVLLSVYAKDLMATPVIGSVNLGILLGLLQFVTTFGLTWLYIRHANKSLDPVVERLQGTVGTDSGADGATTKEGGR